VLHKDLSVPIVREEIKKCSVKYRHRLQVHPNELATSLLNYDDEVRRLKRFKPTDLSDRFN
jgi:hypothetical protein